MYTRLMDKHRDSSNMDFGLRVGTVVEREEALLLVRHEKQDRKPYWVLPGGRLEPGETIPECAERELMEETGLKGRFAGVLYVSEFLQEGRHTVDVTAWVEVGEGGEAQLGSDPEVEEGSDATLKDVRWVGFEELEEMTVLPEFVRNRIVEDQAHGWPTSKVYLGSTDA